MLVLFNAIFDGDSVATPTGRLPIGQFYVASLAGFTVMSGTFTNIVNMLPWRRQDGILKRWRTMPVPRWIYLAGFVGSAVIVAFASMVIMLAVGVAFYGTELDVAKMPAAILTFLVGAASFSALGIAVAGLLRSPDAAPAVANMIALPLAFISNVFVPTDDMPAALKTIADIFPLAPFVSALKATVDPTTTGMAFEWGKLAVVAAWGVAGVVLAARTFRWDPVHDAPAGGGRRSRRRSAASDDAEGGDDTAVVTD